MDNLVKYDKEGKVIDATDSDKGDIECWESLAKEDVDDAIIKLCAQNTWHCKQ